MATTSNTFARKKEEQALCNAPATASIVPNLFLRGA
jgi:hypothetical protein